MDYHGLYCPIKQSKKDICSNNQKHVVIFTNQREVNTTKSFGFPLAPIGPSSTWNKANKNRVHKAYLRLLIKVLRTLLSS